MLSSIIINLVYFLKYFFSLRLFLDRLSKIDSLRGLRKLLFWIGLREIFVFLLYESQRIHRESNKDTQIFSNERNIFKIATVNALVSTKCNSYFNCSQASDLFVSNSELLKKSNGK